MIDLRPHAKERLMNFADLVSRLHQHVEDRPPATLLERIVETVEYEAHLAAEGPEGMERMENVRELLSAAAEWSEEFDPDEAASPSEYFLASAALITSDEQSSGDSAGVTLMTVHTAKGLEWPVVTLAGMEDGLFPLSRAAETSEGLEEERRLAYVALTRAQDRVYVSWARMRRRGGQLLPSAASRFLDALPSEVVEQRRTSGVFGGELYRRATASPSWIAFEEHEPATESQDTPRYVKGERVQHRQFGSGVIRGLAGQGRNLKVVIEFDDQQIGTKQLLVAYAGLERDWESA